MEALGLVSMTGKGSAQAAWRGWFDGDSVRVGVVFLALVAAFESLLQLADLARVTAPLEEATAAAAFWLVRASGLEAELSGIDIILATETLRISLDCTGAFVMAAHVALVLAFPATVRQRLEGLVGGIAILAVANLLRLVAVAQVAVRWPETLDLVHDYLFHVALVMITAVVWVWWIARVRRDG